MSTAATILRVVFFFAFTIGGGMLAVSANPYRPAFARTDVELFVAGAVVVGVLSAGALFGFLRDDVVLPCGTAFFVVATLPLNVCDGSYKAVPCGAAFVTWCVVKLDAVIRNRG